MTAATGWACGGVTVERAAICNMDAFALPAPPPRLSRARGAAARSRIHARPGGLAPAHTGRPAVSRSTAPRVPSRSPQRRATRASRRRAHALGSRRAPRRTALACGCGRAIVVRVAGGSRPTHARQRRAHYSRDHLTRSSPFAVPPHGAHSPQSSIRHASSSGFSSRYALTAASNAPVMWSHTSARSMRPLRSTAVAGSPEVCRRTLTTGSAGCGME
mmetsp:Transcript_11465/g.39968  ORF Transcript_11465/g.39968 Transcript_11465/m.39968 type:complete len:217 (+) Transcript_11465:462-1112(+)